MAISSFQIGLFAVTHIMCFVMGLAVMKMIIGRGIPLFHLRLGRKDMVRPTTEPSGTMNKVLIRRYSLFKTRKEEVDTPIVLSNPRNGKPMCMITPREELNNILGFKYHLDYAELEGLRIENANLNVALDSEQNMTRHEVQDQADAVLSNMGKLNPFLNKGKKQSSYNNSQGGGGFGQGPDLPY